MLRRARRGKNHTVAEFAGWRADFDALTLTGPAGAAQSLSRAEAELLRAFLEAQGRVVTREFLLDTFGGDEAFDRAVDVRVSRLRKKLGEDPRQPAHIRTVYGAGYVFATPVRWG